MGHYYIVILNEALEWLDINNIARFIETVTPEAELTHDQDYNDKRPYILRYSVYDCPRLMTFHFSWALPQHTSNITKRRWRSRLREKRKKKDKHRIRED